MNGGAMKSVAMGDMKVKAVRRERSANEPRMHASLVVE